MAAMVSSNGAPTIHVMRCSLTSGERPLLPTGCRYRMLVFIVTPTLPNSSMAPDISAIAASMWGIGVAANARTGPDVATRGRRIRR